MRAFVPGKMANRKQARGPDAWLEKGQCAPLSVRARQSVQIDVMMGGQSLLMKLDTGATMSLIPDVVAAYIVRNGNGAWQEPVRFRLADGTIWEAKVVLINEVRIGRHVARNVRVGVSSSEGSLLSFSLLDDIAPFTINTRNRELVFHTEANL